jgi:hypothetical protein
MYRSQEKYAQLNADYVQSLASCERAAADKVLAAHKEAAEDNMFVVDYDSYSHCDVRDVWRLRMCTRCHLTHHVNNVV